MGDPKRIGVTGPLAAYRDGFVEELIGKGYTAGAMQQVWLLADLSRWLEGRDLGAGDLTPARVEEFRSARRAKGYTALLSERALLPLLGYLRDLGVAPVAPQQVASTAAEALVEEYSTYPGARAPAGAKQRRALPRPSATVPVPVRARRRA
jgi:hypothetical protein